MFMKTRWLIIDRQLKRSISKKLLKINRKKQKTEHSSSLGNQVGRSKKPNIQNKKGIPSYTPFTTTRKSKRKLSSIFKKVISSRKKQKMEKVDKVDEVVEPTDRISELPEPIIHHILSLLHCPRDVARITALSKKWRSIWASFFFFNFDQKRFKTSGGDHTEKFITFVDNSLASKLDPMVRIHKFKISLSQINPKLKLYTNKWVYSAIKRNVKELEIHVEEKKKKHYMLPNFILTSSTLTSLRLSGCKFDNEVIINLHNLKELSIKNSHVDKNVIPSFIRGCPLVEDLRLVHCRGIGHLEISTPVKLTRVELHECHGLVVINLEVPSLTSFLYIGKKSWFCEINIGDCENLKCLTLKDSNLTDEEFQEMIIKFDNLEKIALRECDYLERITILSMKLKELSVIRCKNVEDVIIDAPNLSVLEYFGERMPFSCMSVGGLCEAKLNLQNKKDKFVPLKELLIFLMKFRRKGDWKMVVSSNKNVTIHEELNNVPYLTSHDLKIELIKSHVKMKGYIGNLLRMSRPKTLSLVSSSSSEFLKFVKEKIMSREKNPKCCTYYSKKCWLHFIKDVKMVVFEGDETSQQLQQTTFQFTWKS
ncbi:putative FBD-associated F-box protein At5g56400 [Lactuca sativa]|uniref:putative FBD-associated F-box protein At5g56400 n=1 Tax=Lactuca sativa TaxID=4236 RepID=UPI000CD8939D|nr:putative FBD-associated F-box protein At5g56400 [Lactuca sativa]XP_023749163.1 putative FBD-associated F-box protein At5g56400 [Lactuca sativa]